MRFLLWRSSVTGRWLVVYAVVLFTAMPALLMLLSVVFLVLPDVGVRGGIPEHGAGLVRTAAVLCGICAVGAAALTGRCARFATRLEVVVDGDGVELNRPARWCRRADSMRLGWDRIRVVSAWQVRVPQRRYTAPLRVPTRPVLDLHLASAAEVPGWVGAVASTAPGGGDSTLIRLDHQVRRDGSVIRRLAEALGRMRPEVFYRGEDVEQCFTPPARDPRSPETAPEPDALSSLTLPSFTAPVWVDLRRGTWKAAPYLAALVVLFSFGTASELWYPLVGGLSGLGLLLSGALLVVVLWSAPRHAARRGVLVGPDGLEFVQEARLWRRLGTLRAVVPWEQVREIRAHESVHGKVLDIEVAPRSGLEPWKALDILRVEQEGANLLRTGFPAEPARWRGQDVVGPEHLPDLLFRARPDLCRGLTP